MLDSQRLLLSQTHRRSGWLCAEPTRWDLLAVTCTKKDPRYVTWHDLILFLCPPPIAFDQPFGFLIVWLRDPSK